MSNPKSHGVPPRHRYMRDWDIEMRALPSKADLEPTAESEAIDSRDNGFLAGASAHAHEAGRWVGHHLARLRVLADLALFDEILASGEGLVAGSGDHGDAQ